MKKIKSFKLFAGIALFVHATLLLAVIAVLSIQKKSIPKAVIAVLATTGIMSAWLLISYKHEDDRMRKLREMDAFYDYDYEASYNGLDGGEESKEYDLGIDEHAKLIPDIDE